MEKETSDFPNELAYDLRQTYARIVGIHLIEAEEAMSENRFYEWFKALENIKTVTKHKWKEPKTNLKLYATLVEVIRKIANQYSNTWTGKAHIPEQMAKIDEVLRELEEFLYAMMQKGKVFGEGSRIPGL